MSHATQIGIRSHVYIGVYTGFPRWKLVQHNSNTCFPRLRRFSRDLPAENSWVGKADSTSHGCHNCPGGRIVPGPQSIEIPKPSTRDLKFPYSPHAAPLHTLSKIVMSGKMGNFSDPERGESPLLGGSR